MSPEAQYMELATIKDGEVFIEWAIMLNEWNSKDGLTVIKKLPIKKVVSEKDINPIIRKLKEEYNADTVKLIMISK